MFASPVLDCISSSSSLLYSHVLWNAEKVKIYLKHTGFLVAGKHAGAVNTQCNSLTGMGGLWQMHIWESAGAMTSLAMCQTCSKKPKQSYSCFSLWNWVIPSCCASFSYLMCSCRYHCAVLRADAFFILLCKCRLLNIFLQCKKGKSWAYACDLGFIGLFRSCCGLRTTPGQVRSDLQCQLCMNWGIPLFFIVI